MSKESDNPELSVSVSEMKVSVRGKAYDDLRPLIKTSIATATSVLQVLENAVGVSTDFANHHLKRFRKRYQDGVKGIPVDFREIPPFRLGCTVIREVVFAAEEPEIQEVFAQLLLTGSDSRTQKDAHPGFAVTIGQLTTHDAQFLIHLKENGSKVRMQDLPRVNDSGDDITEMVFYNLRRLGLIDWWHIEPNPFFPENAAKSFADHVQSASTEVTIGDFQAIQPNLKEGLEMATRGLSRQIVHLLEQTQNPFGVKITPYGRAFVDSCLGTLTEAESQKQN